MQKETLEEEFKTEQDEEKEFQAKRGAGILKMVGWIALGLISACAGEILEKLNHPYWRVFCLVLTTLSVFMFFRTFYRLFKLHYGSVE